MITVLPGRCNGCGLCLRICHEGSLSLAGASVTIDSALCDRCTQCIAICPRQALAWDGTAPARFERPRLPSPEQFLELIQERRSIRIFKDQPVERPLLAEIAASGVYAPTHNQLFKAVIVDDPELIARLSAALLAINRAIYNLAYRSRLVAGLARLMGQGDELEKARPKIEEVLQRGTVFGSAPAAFIIVVGRKGQPLAESSAQYTLANMMYYAQLKGVGACLWGNAQIFLDRHPGARRRLGLAKHERIYGALYLGYPAVKFSNRVAGKALPIQWNGQAEGALG